MKEIKLTQGQVALVDDEDFEYLSKFKWHTQKTKYSFYASRTFLLNNKKVAEWMHRVIMKTPDNSICDHIDHNGLNNQKKNLRNCTRSENAMNKIPTGKIKYLGVSYCTLHGRIYIKPQIRVNGEVISLRCCDTEEQAARRYDAAALFFHGEFANLNFK